MNFKESLVYNHKFFNDKNKNLDKINKFDIISTEILENTNEFTNYNNICPLIEYIKKKYKKEIFDYNYFIEKIEELFGNFIFCISKDEDENFLLLNKNIISSDLADDQLDTYTTTLYLKSPFKKVFSFLTPISTNNNAMHIIKNFDNNKFNNLIFKNSIEGIDVILFYDHNKNSWKTTTEKSLNGNDLNYREKKINYLFDDIIKSKNINLEDFKNDKIYYFKLVHHKNNGILNYNHYGCGYKELFLDIILFNDENHNSYINFYPNSLNFEKKPNIKFINKLKFENIQDLTDNLNQISYDNISNKKITLEGYNIYDNNNKIIKNYKLQTHIYQQIFNNKPKFTNIHLGYLELYQENKLKEYLPYYTNYHGEIIHRISMSIRTISKELLDIYHYLKKNKKSELYNNITNNYKKILYKIHGIYIDSRKNDFLEDLNIQIKNSDILDDNKNDIKSITIHDIYHYLKSLPTQFLKQIYFDRETMLKEKKIDENIYKLFSTDCIYTITQTKLMII